MKKIFLIISFSFLFIQIIFSQVSIATDNFDTPADWIINTVVGNPINSVVPGANQTELAGTPTTDNRWLINNVYHNDAFNCAGFSVSAADVPVQPVGIPNSNTNYLHITAGCAVDAGEVNANWNASLQYKRRFFAYMDYDFNTTNYYSVNFSYWSTNAAGISVFYSTNGGTTWNLIEDTPNDGAWIKSNISIANFDNQGTLRFGFLWDDNEGGNSNYPSIDALELTVPELTCNFFEDKTTVCVTDTVTFTNLSQPVNTGVTYSWAVTPGTVGVNWLFVPPTNSNSQHPQIQFLTSAAYNVMLTVTRSATSESINQTDVIYVISGCQCTSGGGTTALINDDPILGNWTLTNSSGGNWQPNAESGNFNAGNPAGNEAYLHTMSTTNGSYADMSWQTDLDFSDASSTFELSFIYSNEMFAGSWGNYQNTLQVYISTNSGGTWTLIQTYDSDTGASWVSETIDLSSYAGSGSNVRIRFRGIRSVEDSGLEGAWNIGLNDILLTETTTGGGTGDEPTATVTLTNGTNPSCSGTNLEFTCTAANLDGAIVSDYEWYVDGTSVQTGASNTYTTNTLTDGQAVTCAITLSGGTCAGPFVSEVYNVSIAPVLTPHVWIDADPATNICQGTNILFTAMPTNGGTTPTYLWELNGGTVGTGTTFSSTTLADGDVIDLTMTSNVTCPSTNPVTDSYTVTVNDTTIVTIVYNTPAVCSNTPTIFSVNATNGTPVFNYEWFLNGASTGITTSTYGPVSLNYNDEVYLVQSSTTSCPGQSNTISVMGLDPVNSLSGAYTIQTGSAEYPTLTAAIDSLMIFGVKGPVTFDIVDLTYNEQLLIPNICGVDATNTITFQSWCDDCGMPVVEFDADGTDNYILQLDNTKYMSFKKIDFRVLGSANGHIIDISNQTNNINFEDCIFTGISTTGNSSDFALINSENQNISNISFINNEFNDGSFGINITEDNTQLISNLKISENSFTNQSYMGMYLQSIDAPIISRNIITTNSTNDNYCGIGTSYITNDLIISNNKISTTTADGYGMYLINLQSSAGNEGLIANNMVQIGENGVTRGIYLGQDLYTTEYQNIYFNSINSTSSGAGSVALWLNNLSGNINVINNNLFGNSNYAIRVNPPASISSSDYNNFFTTGANLGNWNGTDCSNLATWQTNSSQDANAISINPNYLSLTDLHTENAGLSAGTTITGITTDYDGETRQAPYIGADEYLGTVMWTGATDTDWNNITNWNPNTYISSNTNIQIPSVTNFPETNSNIDNLAECKNITIDNGAHLYIAPTKYLTVWGDMNQNGTFIIQSDASGTGSFINKGAINYGGSSTTTVQRYISEANWHYVSSPITAGNSNLFNSPNFYLYNETINDSWNMNTFTGGFMGWEIASGLMNIQQGYATYQLEETVDFTGILNSGNLTYNLSFTNVAGAAFDGWNLVGNPYPSSVNWDDANNITRTNVDAAIYFYQDNGTGNYNNYSYFLPQINTSPYPAVSVNRVSGCIPVSQGFFLKANAGGASVQFTNDARIHNSTQFFKNSNENEPPTIRLMVKNNEYEDETLIRFIPEATGGYDGEYDAFKMSGSNEEIAYIYTFTDVDSINLAINSLPEIDKYSIVPIGFRAGSDGTYTLNTTELILPALTTAFLYDKYLEKTMNLDNVSSYTFSSEEGNFRDRFQIIFEIDETIDIEKISEDVQIYSNKKNIFVNLGKYHNEKIQIIILDISGKKLIDRYLVSDRNYFNMNKYASGIYMVKLISNENNHIKKVILSE